MDQRDTAKHVLNKALHAIEEGGKKHGDASASFRMIGQLWGIYLDHNIEHHSGTDLHILPHHVAAMMSLLKIARATYSYEFDNYVDEAGYAALQCMLNPTTTHTERDQ